MNNSAAIQDYTLQLQIIDEDFFTTFLSSFSSLKLCVNVFTILHTHIMRHISKSFATIKGFFP